MLPALCATFALLCVPGTAQALLSHRFLYELEGPKPATQFNNPCGVTIDSHGDIYVASGGNDAIDVFDPAGEYLTSISTAPDIPCGLAIDSQGILYAREETLENSLGKVVPYTPKVYPPIGGTTYAVGEPISKGESGTGENRNIKSVAANPADDHVFVDKQSRVFEYDSAAKGSGLLNGEIGAGLFFGTSFGMDVEGAGGNVYATSGFEGKVYVLEAPTYKVLRTVDGSNAKEGAFGGGHLENVALDQEDGHLLVVDHKHGVIDEFDSAGEYVTQIGPGFGAESISLEEVNAVDVAVDNGAFSPNNGNIYVTSGRATKRRLFVFGPLEEPRPEVTTGAASEASPSAATLNGSVNPNSLELKDCHFEYVGDAAFSNTGFQGALSAPCAESPAEIGSGIKPVSVHAKLSGLTPGVYHFRLSAENETPPAVTGKASVFGPPVIATKEAFPTFYTEATTRATINPEGFATAYKVEYGLDESYGQSTTVAELSPGAGGVSVEVALTGLKPSTEYHYRVTATNAVNTSNGPDQTLTTLAEPPVESCSNAQFRVGPSAGLPDCRAYELVSPAQTNGLPPTWPPSDAEAGNFDTALAAPDGESAIFMIEGTLPGSQGNGVRDAHLARRGSNGWTDTLFSPSGAQTEVPTAGGVSPDQLYSFWSTKGKNGSLDPDKRVAHYIRRPAALLDPSCTPEPEGQFEMIGCGSLGTDPEAVGRWITAKATHVIFTTSMGCGVCTPAVQLEPDAPADGIGAVYDRTSDGITHVVSLLPGNATPAGEATYQGVSADGAAVAFSLTEAGTTRLYERRNNEETLEVESGETTFAGLSASGDSLFFTKAGALYDFNAGLGGSVQIASGGGAAFVNVSADGSTVYFASTLVLTGGEENNAGKTAQAGKDNLYRWDAGSEALRFVVTLAHSDLVEFGGSQSIGLTKWTAGLDPAASGVNSGPAQDPSRTTPDGGVLVFQSHAPLSDYDSEGHSEIYRYEDATGDLACVSCSPADAPAESDAELHPFNIAGAPIGALNHIANITEDGKAVFFQSADRLSPADLNSAFDVYEWREGRLSLISGGKGNASSFLYAMSPSGRDVFFTTYDALLAPDEEGGAPSLYDARVEGGFPTPQGPPICQGDACQGAPGPPPALPGVPSATFQSHEGGPKRACPKGKRKVDRGSKTRCVSKKHHRKQHRRRGARQ